MRIMDMQQIRINAVNGVCARQRELIAENRQLRKKAKFNDELDDVLGFSLAVIVTLICIIGGLG